MSPILKHPGLVPTSNRGRLLLRALKPARLAVEVHAAGLLIPISLNHSCRQPRCSVPCTPLLPAVTGHWSWGSRFFRRRAVLVRDANPKILWWKVQLDLRPLALLLEFFVRGSLSPRHCSASFPSAGALCPDKQRVCRRTQQLDKSRPGPKSRGDHRWWFSHASCFLAAFCHPPPWSQTRGLQV